MGFQGQACIAVPQVVRKDWQSCFSSSSMVSLSRLCILSLWACCRVCVWSAQAASTLQIEDVYAASASQIMAAHWAFTSQIALVVWASFWWKAASVSETHFLWQVSMDTFVISSCPMALLSSACRQSTSLGRAPVSAPVGVLDGVMVGMLAASGVSSTSVVGDKWLLGTVLSSMSDCGDTGSEVVTDFCEFSALVQGGAP